MVDTKLLRSRMLLAGYSQRRLANETNINITVLNKKINNSGVFRCDEVDKICKALNITEPTEMRDIFFA